MFLKNHLKSNCGLCEKTLDSLDLITDRLVMAACGADEKIRIMVDPVRTRSILTVSIPVSVVDDQIKTAVSVVKLLRNAMNDGSISVGDYALVALTDGSDIRGGVERSEFGFVSLDDL